MSGRPTDYCEEYPEQAEKLCKLGATDKELADFFEIAESTLNLWKQEHKEFSESIKKGKTLADAEVASKLYHRAIGYEHPDTHFSAYEGEVKATPMIKHYAPDPVAAIFWLKNRQRAKWRDRTEQEVSGSVFLKFDAIDAAA
jgi:cell fate (sporulation/competence/biofilm development) regulator YmcA (YheA/YmcA/DUF963 family)